jgi:ABC-type bacteriocin/lantibiotic exporter with double-glycine peptidase domain
MGTYNKGQIQNGIFIFFFVVAAILFLTGNAKIAGIVIVIGAVIIGFILLSQKRKRDRSAQPLDQKEVAKFKTLFSQKLSGELKAIYAKRVTDEYQAEAIEAVRKILVERSELK